MRAMVVAFWLLLTASANPAAPADEPEDAPESIALALDRQERMTVPVTIGDRGPYRFLIDSGSQTTVISSELAAELKLPAGRDVTIIGVGPAFVAPTAHVEEI